MELLKHGKAVQRDQQKLISEAAGTLMKGQGASRSQSDQLPGHLQRSLVFRCREKRAGSWELLAVDPGGECGSRAERRGRAREEPVADRK